MRAGRPSLGAAARAGLLVAALALAACDNTFDPLVPGGPPFSVFGLLDAGADTQWIRINGLRSTLLASTAPTGFHATLENLGTGRITELRDSAMPYVNMLGSEPVYAHNFWTAEPIQAGASYRFRVQADSAVAESVVRVPRDYRWEVWISEPLTTDASKIIGSGPDAIWVGGVKQLVCIARFTTYEGNRPPTRCSPVLGPGGDSISRTVTIYKDTAVWRGDSLVTKREVELVVSDAPWPVGQDYNVWKLNPGSNASNVSNSFGFIGGVLQRRIPYERCEFTYANATDRYCKLRYDSTTATLRGRISSSCPILPDQLDISLREIDPAPSAPPRIRRPYHDRQGNYEIGALRPGLRHELIVRDTALYLNIVMLTDTLRFTAGQQATYNGYAVWPYPVCPPTSRSSNDSPRLRVGRARPDP